ncbi:ABC transporter permease subunit [Fictibacillus fluitans]|uniref:ABC transporter permease subunit n=1 Tax=Fictibacillus fluitans TaxID=3058422 RepID=A0ABT8HW19_9BACL|nr:ABC transporter permease subunit [Fictibacillus sp. NE201]MDN4524949.1 ABC transporter permease subunit [Fictibacillus sp. NE201]
MNMFLHELRENRRSMMIWTISLAAVTVLFFSMYPSIEKDGDQFIKVLQNYPEGVLKALGVQINSITSLLGFYSYFFLYIMLCGAIQAMNLGTGILSKEVSGKTAEFLLTKPVTRGRIITSKMVAVLVILLITNLVFVVVSYIMANTVAANDFDTSAFFLISAANFFVQLMFAALGFFVSALFPRIRSVLPVSLGTVFAFFIISMFGSAISDEASRYITPFKYFDLPYIMKHTAYEPLFMGLGAAVIVIAVGAGSFLFMKKDIHAA